MQITVNDLKTFYADAIGQVVRRIIRAHVMDLWPECKGLRVMGFGFAGSYLKPYGQEAERTFTIMPRAMGVHHWPVGEKNLVCLADEGELPIETNSIDRIIVVHSLEFCDSIPDTYRELWRVLKSTGRLLVIVPNRLGLWARADWTPFGRGTPYSATQVRQLLTDHQFVHDQTRKVLFVPPFKNALLLRSAQFFESMGKYICSALCGLHMVEVSKQIYASRGTGLAEKVKTPRKSAVPAALANNSTLPDDHAL